MKKFLAAIFLFILTASSSYGSWNDYQDEISEQLISVFPHLDSVKYREDYKQFIKLRKKCLQNTDLQKKLAKMSESDKELVFVPKEKVIIKKRSHDHIYELFAWEISSLLGIDSCIVPSFAFEIGGKKVIMQKLEPFVVAQKETGIPPRALVNSVSLENYWKAHLWAYLLGIRDMSGKNIGINEEGDIRLFDIESTFIYQSQPKRARGAFHTGFFMESFRWPQYRQPLDEQTVVALRQFVESLSSMEDDITMYLLYRPFPLDKDNFLYRLEQIKNFYFEEGAAFCDFYSYLFPRVGRGFDSLCALLSKSLGKKIDHGDALKLFRKGCKKKDLPEKTREKLERWMEAYID